MKSIDEHLIRDKLCEKLDKIERGLIFCEKECYLKAPAYGTRGFIDILAKDRYGRAVVIELKTRRSTTREAIHELIKYSEYLQKQFEMTPSEIRLMLIATDWTELLIPFSSFFAQTHMNLEGYQIFINDENEISKIEKIIPVESSTRRLFSDCMLFLWCENAVIAEQLIYSIKKHYKKKEFENYILLKLKASENFEIYEKLSLSQIAQNLDMNISLDEYHSPQYCLCIASKSYSFEELLTLVKDEDEFHETLIKNGYGSEKEVPLFYLHHMILYHDIWHILPHCSNIEIGEPAKLSAHINQNGWIIEEVIRGLTYEKNHFLSDETIKNELLGDVTTDKLKVFIKFRTDNRSSLYHAKQIVKEYLDGNLYWRIPLLQVFENIINQHIQVTYGCVKYLDQMSILRYLYLFAIDEEPDSLLPRTVLSYTTYNQEKRRIEQIKYICIYEKTHESLPFEKILEKYYENSISTFRVGAIFDGYREDNLEIAYDMGFECTVYKETVLNYFPVRINENTYQILQYCNEPPIYEKYDFIRNSYVKCSIDSDVFKLSYERFIHEEKEFVEKLLSSLDGSENSLFLI